VEGGAVAVRVEEMHDTGHQVRLPDDAARVAGGSHRPGGRPVIGAVAGQDLVPAGVAARQLDGVLVGIRPAQREQDLGQRLMRGDLRHHLLASARTRVVMPGAAYGSSAACSCMALMTRSSP
jgi:hypothetical protein